MFVFRYSRFLACLMFPLVLAGCGGHGPRVQHGSIEVYYVDGTTKAEADRLGQYLVKTWGEAPAKRSVQIKKDGEGYQFRMVVKKEFLTDEKTLDLLQFDAARISRDVFDGAAVELHACDEHLKTVKSFPPRADVRYSLVEGNVELFYATPDDKVDAQRLSRYLAELVKVAPAQISFKLARREKVIEIHMAVRPDSIANPGLLEDLRRDRAAIAARVFPGAVVEMHLCDPSFNTLKVLTP